MLHIDPLILEAIFLRVVRLRVFGLILVLVFVFVLAARYVEHVINLRA